MIPIALEPKKQVVLQAKPPDAWGAVPGFDMAKQYRTNWCWAAVAQAVALQLDGLRFEQCDIIEQTLDIDKCCDDPDTCNEPFYTEKALGTLRNLREPALEKPLKLKKIEEEIPPGATPAALPIGCGFRDPDGAGHAVAISGWKVINGKVRVWVEDPKDGFGTATSLKKLTDGTGREWVETYLTKMRSDI